VDLAALRSLVREVNFGVHGVAAVVTVPDGEPVATSVIWLTPASDSAPIGATFQRADPQRRMAIRRDDVPVLPRGTIVEVTEHLRDETASWSVDSIESVRPDHYKVVVVPITVAT
jgi:hypothetical protein